MEGELRLDLSTYRAMVRATLGRRLWLLRALGALIVVAALAGVVADGDVVWAVVYLLIGVVVLGYDEVITRSGWRRLRGITDRPWRYRINDGGVSVQTPATNVELGWDAIIRTARARQAWVLRTTTRQRVPIPRAAFSPDDVVRIDQRLATLRSAS